ncbi:hypothetical protein AK88_03381 [Plasmodium fragile]|uniref:AP2/ERF domain-containing protein n=1 Tax=Plasmodium fragile TaxID=5857 RepID=A0A0D9QJI9_PLAFR|nr:uncharacterized protein AK88_03381 [Plasmodium fragile]KJP86982.1 hypothetical protein AK88_03381 [Plasmodium fragile]
MEKQSKTEGGKANKPDLYKNYMDEMNVVPSILQNKHLDSFASNSTIDENKLMNVNDLCNLYLDRNPEKGSTKRVVDGHMEEEGTGEPKESSSPGMVRNNSVIDFLNTPIVNDNGVNTNNCLSEARKVVLPGEDASASDQIGVEQDHTHVKEENKTNGATSLHTDSCDLTHTKTGMSEKDLLTEENWVKHNPFLYKDSSNYAEQNGEQDPLCGVSNYACNNEKNSFYGNGVELNNGYNHRFIKHYLKQLMNKPKSVQEGEELNLDDKAFDVNAYLRVQGCLPKDDALPGEPVFGHEAKDTQGGIHVNDQTEDNTHKKLSTPCDEWNNYTNATNEEAPNEGFNKGVANCMESCMNSCNCHLANHSEDTNHLSSQMEHRSKGEDQNLDHVFKNIAMKIHQYLRNCSRKMIFEEGKQPHAGSTRGIAQGSIHHPADISTSALNSITISVGGAHPASSHMHAYPSYMHNPVHMNTPFHSCTVKDKATLQGSIKITVPLFLLYITNAYGIGGDVTGGSSSNDSAHAMRRKKLKQKIINEIIFGFTYADADKYVEQLLCNIKKCFLQVLDYLKEYNPQWVCSNNGDSYFYHFRKIMAINSSYVDVNSIVHYARVLTSMKRKKWTGGPIRGVVRSGLDRNNVDRKVPMRSGNAKIIPFVNALLPNATSDITRNEHNDTSGGGNFYQGVKDCGFNEPIRDVDGPHCVGRSLKRKHSLGEEKNLHGYTHKQIKTDTISTDANCTNNELSKNEPSFVEGAVGLNEAAYGVEQGHHEYDPTLMASKEADAMLCTKDMLDVEDKIYYAPSDMRTSIETVINENGKGDKYERKLGLKVYGDEDELHDDGAQGGETFAERDVTATTPKGEYTPLEEGAPADETHPDDPLHISHIHHAEQNEQDVKNEKKSLLSHLQESTKKEEASTGKESPNGEGEYVSVQEGEDSNGEAQQEKTGQAEDDADHTSDLGESPRKEQNDITSCGDGLNLQSSIMSGVEGAALLIEDTTSKPPNVHPTMYDQSNMFNEQCVSVSEQDTLNTNERKTSACDKLNYEDCNSVYESSHFTNSLPLPLDKTNDLVGTVGVVAAGGAVGTDAIQGATQHEEEQFHVAESTNNGYLSKHITNEAEVEQGHRKFKNRVVSLNNPMNNSIMHLNINKKKKKKKKMVTHYVNQVMSILFCNDIFNYAIIFTPILKNLGVLSSLSTCTMNNILLRLEHFKLIEVDKGKIMHKNKSMLLRGGFIHMNEKTDCFATCSPNGCVLTTTSNKNARVGGMYGDGSLLGRREETALQYLRGIMEKGGQKGIVDEEVMKKLGFAHHGEVPCSGGVCPSGHSAPFGVQNSLHNNLHNGSFGVNQDDPTVSCSYGKGQVVHSCGSEDGVSKNQLMEFIREVLIQHGAYINQSVELNSNDSGVSGGEPANDGSRQCSKNGDEESCGAVENDVTRVSEKMQNNETDRANGVNEQIPFDDSSASLQTQVKKKNKFNFIEQRDHDRIDADVSDVGKTNPQGIILNKENFFNLLKWYLSIKVPGGCDKCCCGKSHVSGQSRLCDRGGPGGAVLVSGVNACNHDGPLNAYEKDGGTRLHLCSGDKHGQVDTSGGLIPPSDTSKGLHYGAFPYDHHEGRKTFGTVHNTCANGNNNVGANMLKAQGALHRCSSFEGEEAAGNGLATSVSRTCGLYPFKGWKDANQLHNSHEYKANVCLHDNHHVMCSPMCCVATQHGNNINDLLSAERAACTPHSCNGITHNHFCEEHAKLCNILNEKNVKSSLMSEQDGGENNEGSNICGGELGKIIFNLIKSGQINLEGLPHENFLFDSKMMGQTNDSTACRHRMGQSNNEMYACEHHQDATHGGVSTPPNCFSYVKRLVGEGGGNGVMDVWNHLAPELLNNKNEGQVVKEEDIAEGGQVQGQEKLLRRSSNECPDVKLACENVVDGASTNCGIGRSGLGFSTANGSTCTQDVHDKNYNLWKLYHLYELLEKEKNDTGAEDKMCTDMQNEWRKYFAKHNNYLLPKGKVANSFPSCDHVASDNANEQEGSSGNKVVGDGCRLHEKQLYLLSKELLHSRRDNNMQFASSMEEDNGLLPCCDKDDGGGGCGVDNAVRISSNHMGNVIGGASGSHLPAATTGEEGMYKDTHRTYKNFFLNEEENQRNETSMFFHRGHSRINKTNDDRMKNYLSSLYNSIVYKSGFYPTEGSNHNGAQSSGGSGNICFNTSNHMNRCTDSRRSSNLCDYLTNFTYSSPNENCNDNFSHVDELGKFLLVQGEHSNSRDGCSGGSAPHGLGRYGSGRRRHHRLGGGGGGASGVIKGSSHNKSFAHLYKDVVSSLDHRKTRLCNKHMNNSMGGFFNGRNNTDDDIILHGYLTRKRREEMADHIQKKRALLKKIKNAENMTDEEINTSLMQIAEDPMEFNFLKRFYLNGGGDMEEDPEEDDEVDDDDDDDHVDGGRRGGVALSSRDHDLNGKKKIHMKNVYLGGRGAAGGNANLVKGARHKDMKGGNSVGCSVGGANHEDDDENVSSVESTKIRVKGERGKNVNFFLNNFTLEYGRGRRNKVINQNYMKNYELESRYYGRRDCSTGGGAAAAGAEAGMHGNGNSNGIGGGHGKAHAHMGAKLNGVCYTGNGRGHSKDKTKLHHLETATTTGTSVGRGNNASGKGANGGNGSRRTNTKGRNNGAVDAIENYEYKMSASELKPQRGVYFDRSQKAWIGSWYEEGKQIKRRFKIKYYGWDEARNLATKARFAFENRTKHIKGAGKKGASATTTTTATAGVTAGATAEGGVSNGVTSGGGNNDGTEAVNANASGGYTRAGERKEEDAANLNKNGTNEEGVNHVECGSYVDGTNRRITSRRGGGAYLRATNENHAVESSNAPTNRRDGRRGATHKMKKEDEEQHYALNGKAAAAGDDDDDEEDVPTQNQKKLKTHNNPGEGKKNEKGVIPPPYPDPINYNDVGGESTNKYEAGGREKYPFDQHHMNYEDYHPAAYDKKRNIASHPKGDTRGGGCNKESGVYDSYARKYANEYKGGGDMNIFSEWNEIHRAGGGMYESGAGIGDYPLSGMSSVNGLNDLGGSRGKAKNLSQDSALRHYEDYYMKGGYPDGKPSADHTGEDEHVSKEKNDNEPNGSSCVSGGRRRINNHGNHHANHHARNVHEDDDQDDGDDEEEEGMNLEYCNQMGTTKRDRANRENNLTTTTEHKGKNSNAKCAGGKGGDNVITYAKSNNKKSNEANQNQMENSVILPQGVFYQDSKKAFCANWYSNGKQEKRYFSINKFGEERARNLAIEARKKFEHDYKKNHSGGKKETHHSSCSVMKAESSNDITGLDSYEMVKNSNHSTKHNYVSHAGKGAAAMNTDLITTAGMNNLNQGDKSDVGHNSIDDATHSIGTVDGKNAHMINSGANGKAIGGAGGGGVGGTPPKTSNDDQHYVQQHGYVNENNYSKCKESNLYREDLYRSHLCRGDLIQGYPRTDGVYNNVMPITTQSDNIRMNVVNNPNGNSSTSPPYTTNNNAAKDNIKLVSSPAGSNSTTDMVNNNVGDCVVSNGRGGGEGGQNDVDMSMSAPLSNTAMGAGNNVRDNEGGADPDANGVHNGNGIDNSLGANMGMASTVTPPFRSGNNSGGSGSGNLFVGPKDACVPGTDEQTGENNLYTGGMASKTNEMHHYPATSENMSKALTNEEVNPLGTPFDPNTKEFSTPNYYTGNKQATKNQFTRSIKKEMLDDMNMYTKMEKMEKTEKANSNPAGVYMIRINGIVQAWRAEWRSPSGCKRTKNFGINTYGTTLSKKLAIEMRARMTGECLVSDDGTVFDYTNKKTPK